MSGDNFSATFNTLTGALCGLNYDGKQIIADGSKLALDAFRAYLNNDAWVYGGWFANGLYNLKHKVLSYKEFNDADGRKILSFTVESQAPNGGKMVGGNGNSTGTYTIDESEATPFGPDDFKFVTNQVWTVNPDGSIELNSVITSNNPSVILPRLGYSVQIPRNLDTYTYYGRGPQENYNDRKTGQFVGRYSSKVADQYTDYTRPQSNGNREEVRWAALTDGNSGAVFIAPQMMSATAIPYSEMELFAANHPYKLPDSKATTLHLDLGVTGLGGASCGQGGPLEPDRVKAGEHRFNFIIRPAAEKSVEAAAAVSPSGILPLGISRSRNGMVTVSYPDSSAVILYSVNGAKKPRTYTGPFEMKEAGTVKAWLKNTPGISASDSFSKIETVKTEVIHASSFEPDYGEGQNLVDGDPTTIWHTMYSVTVAGYPHWVDFDAGDVKSIRGVRYLPRQDGNTTGNVKDYEIFVSNDAENWGTPVAKGTFSGRGQQTVMFDSPVKGRYIRFMALSAQDGRDYASGSEFEVIAE